jgi:CRP-like cAMP-binding protein
MTLAGMGSANETDGPRERSPPDDGSSEALAADPELSDGQLARLRAYGSPDELEVGEAAFAAGDPTYDLIVIEQGAIEVVRPATLNAPEASLVSFGPGAFVGELSLLTGQTTYLTARVVERARVHRISPPQLRRLMAQDPELSDLLLGAFLARRRGSARDPRLASCRSSEANSTRRRWRFAPTLGDGSCLTSGWTPTPSRADR